MGADGGGIGPANVPAVAWYDFGDTGTLFQDNARTIPVTTTGQGLLGVTDKSGSENHLNSNIGTPLYLTGGMNGRSVMDLAPNAALKRDTLVGGPHPQPGVEFVVLNIDTVVPSNQQLTDSRNGTSRWSLNLAGALINWYAGTNQSFGTLVVDTPVILVAEYNGAASRAWINGGVATNKNVGVQSKLGLLLGMEQGGSANPTDGQYGEYALTRSLSLSQINAVGAELGTRWGITWTTAT